MHQEWNNLLFVHWRVPTEVVQQRLPRGVTADCYDGSAWVGLVAFQMQRIGIRPALAVPYLGSFPETNIRTYVRGPDGRPGVWFDSLDISRLVPTLVARSTYGLPYMWSSMRITSPAVAERRYTCRRRWGGPAAACAMRATIGPEIASADVSPLERFLTCRWGLYSTVVGRLVYAAVEHPEWPLHRASLVDFHDTLAKAAGYPPPAEAPIVHWTPGVKVRIGRPRRVRVPVFVRAELGMRPSPAGS
jgi:uncharacterized protein YqjF (DUF2071 family)